MKVATEVDGERGKMTGIWILTLSDKYTYNLLPVSISPEHIFSRFETALKTFVRQRKFYTFEEYYDYLEEFKCFVFDSFENVHFVILYALMFHKRKLSYNYTVFLSIPSTIIIIVVYSCHFTGKD